MMRLLRRPSVVIPTSLLVGPVGVFGVLWLTLLTFGMPGAAAFGLSTAAALLQLVPFVVALLTAQTRWFPSRWRLASSTGAWSSSVGVIAGGGAAAVLELGPGVSVVVGLAAAVVSVPLTHRSIRRNVAESPQPLQLRTIREARAAVQAAEAKLRRTTGTDEGQAVIRLQLAEARSVLAMRADEPFQLDLALADVRAIATGAYSMDLRFAAACAQVDAASMLAERSRNAGPYEEAIHLQAGLAEERDEAWARGRAAYELGHYETYRAREASEADVAKAVVHLRRSERAFRSALGLLGDDSAFAPQLHWQIALTDMARLWSQTAAEGAPPPDLTGVIAELRRSMALYRGARRDGAEFVQLSLASALLEQCSAEASTTSDHLDEVEALCRKLVRDRGHPEVHGHAYTLLAEALELRRVRGLVDRDDERAGRRLLELRRKAVEAGRRLSVAETTAAIGHWIEAAEDVGDTAEAAQGRLELTRAIPVELFRLLDRDQQAAYIAAQQGVAPEAGYHLALVGRPDDAVENTRVMLLGHRSRRLPGDLAGRLSAIGRQDLHQQYLEAVRVLVAVERSEVGRTAVPVRLLRAARPGSIAAWDAVGGFARATHAVEKALGEPITAGALGSPARRPSTGRWSISAPSSTPDTHSWSGPRARSSSSSYRRRRTAGCKPA